MKYLLVTICIVLIGGTILFISCKKNAAPDAPSIPNGPTSGSIGTTYNFTTITADPNGDDIAYQFDWGNNDTSAWSTYIPSGESIARSNSWDSSGNYSIRARAKDGKNKISNWSGAHQISILNAWTKTFGGPEEDGAISVQQTTDGGYIIAGLTASYGAGCNDVYLIKTNAGGNARWTKTFGTSDNDELAYCVEQTTDGGYIVVGIQVDTSFYDNDYNIYLVKTDANGNEMWTRIFNQSFFDVAFSVEQTTDGGYIITGATVAPDSASLDLYLIKTNASGNVVWTKKYNNGNGFDDIGYSVEQTTDGGYIIVGLTIQLNSFSGDVYLIKTDADGDLIWSQTYGGSDDDMGQWVRQTSDGGYIIAGSAFSSGTGSYDYYLVKTNTSGSVSWIKTYGGYDDEFGYSVEETSDGGYIMGGYTFGSENDLLLIKTNANGDTIWAKTYGGDVEEIGGTAQQTLDGGYIIVGETFSFGAGNGDIYLIKTDENGNTISPTLISNQSKSSPRHHYLKPTDLLEKMRRRIR